MNNLDLEYIICRDPFVKELNEYFTLRKQVYSEFGLDYYNNDKPTRYDRHPETIFMLIYDKEKGSILGGRRIMVHLPFSLTKIYAEINSKILTEYMLPHLDTEIYKYCELGSLCLHKALRGTEASAELYKKTFEYIKEEEFDFIVSNPVPHNTRRILEEAHKSGIKQFIWRTDIKAIIDGDNDPTLFMSFKKPSELNLLPPEIESKGIGKLPNGEQIEEMIKLRNKEVEQGKINPTKKSVQN